MRRSRVGRIVLMIPFAILFFTVFGYVVMRLWNWLMPGLFGLHVVTFWQALGLLVLSKILFGGFLGRHRHGDDGHWRMRMMKRWEKLTPEEREKMRDAWRGCGPFSPPAEAPQK
jgi:hypothetical protein